jgi:hypothetical protein
MRIKKSFKMIERLAIGIAGILTRKKEISKIKNKFSLKPKLI